MSDKMGFDPITKKWNLVVGSDIGKKKVDLLEKRIHILNIVQNCAN